MNILQMIDVPWDSGLAHYALVLSQALKGRGHRIFVSANPGQKPWAKARRMGLKTVPLASFKGLASLRRFLQKHKIELINAHTGRMHSLAVAATLGLPTAVVRTRSDARGVRRSLASSWLFRRTARVIAAADYIRESYVRQLKLSRRQVVTIHQGIATTPFPLTPVPSEPVIGIIARLDPVKGHRYLLEALALLRAHRPALRLRIIGQEENVKEQDLRRIASRLRIDRQVEFLGYRTDIARQASDCAIGIIASTGSEAVSRAALEWMAAARPVVATRVGCLPELVQDDVTGRLVDPESAPALARAIDELLKHPDRLQAMGRAARRRVDKEFSVEGFATATEQLYEEAVRDACRN